METVRSRGGGGEGKNAFRGCESFGWIRLFYLALQPSCHLIWHAPRRFVGPFMILFAENTYNPCDKNRICWLTPSNGLAWVCVCACVCLCVYKRVYEYIPWVCMYVCVRTHACVSLQAREIFLLHQQPQTQTKKQTENENIICARVYVRARMHLCTYVCVCRHANYPPKQQQQQTKKQKTKQKQHHHLNQPPSPLTLTKNDKNSYNKTTISSEVTERHDNFLCFVYILSGILYSKSKHTHNHFLFLTVNRLTLYVRRDSSLTTIKLSGLFLYCERRYNNFYYHCVHMPAVEHSYSEVSLWRANNKSTCQDYDKLSELSQLVRTMATCQNQNNFSGPSQLVRTFRSCPWLGSSTPWIHPVGRKILHRAWTIGHS